MPIEDTGQAVGQIDFLSGIELFLSTLGFLALILVILAVLAAAVGYIWIIWMRNKDREERSLDFVLLSVAVPRDNEIKIDAAEQMFSSIYSVYRSGTFSFLKPQDHISLELVALPEQLKFYFSCPKSLQDLVEKQIHGAYPGAEVREVEEYNIFSQEGKLAFAALKLKSASYYPIKTYKELATDPLSQITSALAKMDPGEGAALQILAVPADGKWRTAGKRHVTKTKEGELSPKSEGKVVAPEPKKMEAIENKVSKVGFNVIVRIMVSAKTIILTITLKPTLETLFSIASIFLGSGATTLPSDFGESSPSFVFVTCLLPAVRHFPSAGTAKIWRAAPSPGSILAKAEVTCESGSVASSL